MSNNYNVYIDESGNSGLNLFDKDQPFFWIGALLVPEGKSQIAEIEIKPLLKILGKEELHGNELGIRRISDIAEELIGVYKKIKAEFLFVRVEKSHIAAMKFVDTLIDSGHNPAIPHLYYASKGTRLLLAQPIATLFNDESSKVFWDIFRNHKVEEYKDFLKEFKSAVSLYIPDQRLKEILCEAIDFGVSHPEKLLDDSQGEYESPNLVAFSLMIDGIKNILGNPESKIKTIVHDEQNEFARYLEEMFGLLKGLSISHQVVGYPRIEITETYTKDLSFLSSHESAGLQLIDLPLWLLKQEVDNDKKLTGGASLIIDYVKDNGVISHFSYNSLTDETIKVNEEIMNKPFTDQEIKDATDRFRAFEKERKRNLSRGYN